MSVSLSLMLKSTSRKWMRLEVEKLSLSSRYPSNLFSKFLNLVCILQLHKLTQPNSFIL